MKISLNWLSDYVSGPLDPQQVANALTYGGLPVEVIENHSGDTVIDVEVTSNRGDCLSHIGVAREVAALLNREFRLKEPTPAESATPASSVTSVRIDAPELCPHYTARILRNVQIKPSPQWMSQRLEAVGLRPINNIVDATNYVMFEMGQPLHAFDFDKLGAGQIIVRRTRRGERLVSIDGKERPLAEEMLVIADASIPVALAGVMGGRDTEVSDATRNVLLESARFDPLSVRRTSRALSMQSDSSYRFERGIDPTLPARASLRAAQLILETAGGELLCGMVEAGSSAVPEKNLSLRLKRLNRLLGIEVAPEEALEALRRLGIAARPTGDRIEALVPSWRLDLNLEVDLIEEVARVLGYDRIPVRDEISIRLAPVEPDLQTIDKIRSILSGAGCFEAITVTFVSDALKDDFLPPGASGLPRTDPMTRKADAHLRGSMLAGLLEAARRNEAAGNLDPQLFEIGSTFWIKAGGELVERRQLGIVGRNDLHALRGVVELLLNRLDAKRSVEIVPDRRAGMAPSAGGRILWGGIPVGYLGRIARAVCEKLDLRSSPAAVELELEPLLSGAQHVPQLRTLPRFPAIRRDLSLIVAEQVQYQQLQKLVAALALPDLEEMEYVTTYRGKPLEKSTKSVTITLVFRSPRTTLTSEHVEQSVQRVVETARQQLGATLRL